MVRFLQRGEVGEAQTLLNATGCTCPSGKLWHSIYDEKGVEYAIRDARHNYEWVVFEPVGLWEGKKGGKEVDGEIDDDGFGATTTKQVKGKGRAQDEEAGEGIVYRVRCRLSTTGRDHIVEMRKGEKVGEIMKKLSRVTRVHYPHSIPSTPSKL